MNRTKRRHLTKREQRGTVRLGERAVLVHAAPVVTKKHRPVR